MREKGKKKLFATSIILVFLFAIFITAQGNTISKIQEKIIEQKGIDAGSITDIVKVNIEDTPPEVKIKNVGDANIALYQVDFNQLGKPNKVFVIGYSTEAVKGENYSQAPTPNITIPSNQTPGTIPQQRLPKFLNFNSAGEMGKTGFLDSVAGTTGGITHGYIMPASGTVVNVTTNLEVYEEEGNIKVTLYKNGIPTSLTNSFAVGHGKLITNPNTKSYFVYTIKPRGTLSFRRGDVLSVYVSLSDGVVLKKINSFVQIR